VWTGAAVAYKQAKEVGTQATMVGMNASHKDTTFHALLDAVELTKHILTSSLVNSVMIYTANHQVILWCLTTDRHDNAVACRAVCESLSTTLFDHPNTSLTIRWIPRSAGFLPLKCILKVAMASAAATDPVD
jgi:hypothetical protein